VHRGEVVAPAEVAALAGYQGKAPPCSAIIDGWQALLGDKKDHYARICPVPRDPLVSRAGSRVK
jgi:hypothetical protein